MQKDNEMISFHLPFRAQIEFVEGKDKEGMDMNEIYINH